MGFQDSCQQQCTCNLQMLGLGRTIGKLEQIWKWVNCVNLIEKRK